MAGSKHLTFGERVRIERLIHTGLPYLEISEKLSRGIATISREVGRNGGRSHYDAIKAHKKSVITRSGARKKKKITSEAILEMKRLLDNGLSVIEITERLNASSLCSSVTSQSVYRLLDKNGWKLRKKRKRKPAV